MVWGNLTYIRYLEQQGAEGEHPRFPVCVLERHYQLLAPWCESWCQSVTASEPARIVDSL